MYFQYQWTCVCIGKKRKRKRSDSVLWQKPPHPQKSPQKQRDKATQKRHQKVLRQRLLTVSWGNDSHPTGVVNPVYGIQTFPLTEKAVVIKDTHYKKEIVNNPPYKGEDQQPTKAERP